MKPISRISVAILVVLMATADVFPQDQKSASEHKDEKLSRSSGLRKISGPTHRIDVDIDIDEQALAHSIDIAVEQAMTSVDLVLDNLDIRIPPVDIDLSGLDVVIDPIEIDIPDFDFGVDPIDIDFDPIDIDHHMDFDIDTDDSWDDDGESGKDKSKSDKDKDHKDKAKDKSGKDEKAKGLKKLN